MVRRFGVVGTRGMESVLDQNPAVTKISRVEPFIFKKLSGNQARIPLYIKEIKIFQTWRLSLVLNECGQGRLLPPYYG